MSDLSQYASDWVFDFVMHLFHSPAWEVPIMSFIDENCASFDTGDENKFIYSDLHQQFRELGMVRTGWLFSLCGADSLTLYVLR